MLNKYKYYLFQIMISLIIMLIGLIVIKHNQPPTIVKVDLVAVTQHYTELMTKATMSNNTDKVKQISSAIKVNLEPILASYVNYHNVLIVQSQAIVVGQVPDITNQIISQLDAKIK